MHLHCPFSLSTIWELAPAAGSVMVTTCFAIRPEETAHFGTCGGMQLFKLPAPSLLHWITNPSPGTMLGACLVFGCSISSYSHRHQYLDKFQTHIFVLAISLGSLRGIILDGNADLIMLSYIPWALCLAMVFSAISHCVMRWCDIDTEVQLPEIMDRGGPLLGQ